MAEENNPPPISAYVFGKLTAEEQTELMRRALEDQSVFDQLWEAVDRRELLQDPATRARLLRHLEERPAQSRWSALWSWLTGPGGRLLLAGATVCCLALILVHGPDRTWYSADRPLTLVTNPNTNLAVFFQLPLRNPSHARVDLHQSPAVFHPGDVIHATLDLRAPAAVFVLRRQPGGLVRMVFPPDLAAPADQAAGEIPFSFDPVSPIEDVTVRERFVLRIVVLPVGIDLRNQSIDWSMLGRRTYSAMEVSYDVVP